jgi:hypothetical protein
MSTPSRAFSSSNRAQMISSAIVDQNQGGGNKKAGLVPQIGRESYTSVVMGITTGTANGRCGPCLMTMNLRPLANIARPIGSVTQSNTAWKVTGAP